MFFEITAKKNYDNLLEPYFSDIAEHCGASQFQHLTKNELKIVLKTDSFDFPDFLLIKDSVPLFSDYLFNSIRTLDNTDNIFTRSVIIEQNGESEHYIMAVPSRIDCLNLEDSALQSCEEGFYAYSIAINGDAVGRYEMFKIWGIKNPNIYITTKMKKVLEGENPVGLVIK